MESLLIDCMKEEGNQVICFVVCINPICSRFENVKAIKNIELRKVLVIRSKNGEEKQ